MGECRETDSQSVGEEVRGGYTLLVPHPYNNNDHHGDAVKHEFCRLIEGVVTVLGIRPQTAALQCRLGPIKYNGRLDANYIS